MNPVPVVVVKSTRSAAWIADGLEAAGFLWEKVHARILHFLKERAKQIFRRIKH